MKTNENPARARAKGKQRATASLLAGLECLKRAFTRAALSTSLRSIKRLWRPYLAF